LVNPLPRAGRSPVFCNLIQSRIVGDELQTWKEARRRWLMVGKLNDRHRWGLL